ncbi:GNAT family N-acetyltransferase [Metabacillus litoralis]|uniref:GNAT family N-acetyltransferase n=1 Tax=Metabacillus litoralis TaxID=152268 RepID=UPI003084042B
MCSFFQPAMFMVLRQKLFMTKIHSLDSLCHGYRKEHERYELISFMIGYKFQGKGYGVHVLQAVIDDMINMYDCKEIYLSVIVNNDRAIRLYEKLGFKHR